MNKKPGLWRLVFFAFLTIVALLVGQVVAFIYSEFNTNRSPGYFSTYDDGGYFEINPETILGELERGDSTALTPFFGDPNRDEPYYASVNWTQMDYLKIVNALSTKAWNEPLDLEDWKVSFLDLTSDCKDKPAGFNEFTVVYYKERGIKNWERQYTVRLIRMFPWKGLIQWGRDANFSGPLLLGWDSINPSKFNFTADDALQIAEDNGGADIRLRVDNDCRILLSLNLLSPLPRLKIWLVDYDKTNFYMNINPYTGNYKIQR